MLKGSSLRFHFSMHWVIYSAHKLIGENLSPKVPFGKHSERSVRARLNTHSAIGWSRIPEILKWPGHTLEGRRRRRRNPHSGCFRLPRFCSPVTLSTASTIEQSQSIVIGLQSLRLRWWPAIIWPSKNLSLLGCRTEERPQVSASYKCWHFLFTDNVRKV